MRERFEEYYERIVPAAGAISDFRF